MSSMKGWYGLGMRAVAFGAAGLTRALMGTLDYQALFYDESIDAIYGVQRPRIYVFWHEYILLPLHIRGHCNMTMLLSQHRDADVLFCLGRYMGFECVRGSSARGGAAALIELSRLEKPMHIAITPDGPRGPRRKLAPGAVFLASRLGLPIVPMGLGYERPWRARSWDRFAVPKPWSRARGIVGPEIFIEPDLERDELELRRQGVERLLNELTTEAEDWADSGKRRAGQIPVRRQSLLLGSSGARRPTVIGQGDAVEQAKPLRIAS
jgi:lysophospholipid acyltransferase (LPLAT)-like uncharacterized protein